MINYEKIKIDQAVEILKDGLKDAEEKTKNLDHDKFIKKYAILSVMVEKAISTLEKQLKK